MQDRGERCGGNFRRHRWYRSHQTHTYDILDQENSPLNLNAAWHYLYRLNQEDELTCTPLLLTSLCVPASTCEAHTLKIKVDADNFQVPGGGDGRRTAGNRRHPVARSFTSESIHAGTNGTTNDRYENHSYTQYRLSFGRDGKSHSSPRK